MNYNQAGLATHKSQTEQNINQAFNDSFPVAASAPQTAFGDIDNRLQGFVCRLQDVLLDHKNLFERITGPMPEAASNATVKPQSGGIGYQVNEKLDNIADLIEKIEYQTRRLSEIA